MAIASSESATTINDDVKKYKEKNVIERRCTVYKRSVIELDLESVSAVRKEKKNEPIDPFHWSLCLYLIHLVGFPLPSLAQLKVATIQAPCAVVGLHSYVGPPFQFFKIFNYSVIWREG